VFSREFVFTTVLLVSCSPTLTAVWRPTIGIRAIRRDLRRDDIAAAPWPVAAAPWPDAAAEQGRHVGGQQDPVTLAERQDAAAHADPEPFSTAPITRAMHVTRTPGMHAVRGKSSSSASSVRAGALAAGRN